MIAFFAAGLARNWSFEVAKDDERTAQDRKHRLKQMSRAARCNDTLGAATDHDVADSKQGQRCGPATIDALLQCCRRAQVLGWRYVGRRDISQQAAHRPPSLCQDERVAGEGFPFVHDRSLRTERTKVDLSHEVGSA